MLFLGLPFSMIVGAFFKTFAQNWLKGFRARPKGVKRHQNKFPRSLKWRPGVPNWSPKVPQSTKKTQKCTPRCKNVGAGATMKPQVTHNAKKTQQGHPKRFEGTRLDPRVPKNTYKPPAAGCSPQAVAYKSGRGSRDDPPGCK